MPTVLVVDDHVINRYLRAEILTRAGYSVLHAENGTQALELCSTRKPDLVLLDIHLPDINGLEVCNRIKREPETSSTMVIQISASAIELKDALAGLEGGADDYLVEPTEPEFLVAKVRSLLRLHSAENRLRQSNEALTQFAFAASHDLQEPLRGVITYAELLQRDYADRLDDNGREFLSGIINGGLRMSSLIRDLLEYARVTTTADNSQNVDMNEVLDQTRDWFGERLSESGATLTYDSLPVVKGSAVRLAQVIRNLVENSVKYRRNDVPLQVHVSAQSRGREWVFTVTDNGQGFDPAFREEIFDVFRRIGGRSVAGTGIGLAICRTVVEAAGGKIWAEGRPNEGATFYFTWPATLGAAIAG
jgi:signal transduction histidine kinase